MNISVLGGNKGEISFNCEIDYILEIIGGSYTERDKNPLLANLQNISSARLAKKRGDLEAAKYYKQKLISVTYNATFEKNRRKDCVKELSGLIYLDYDNVDTVVYKERMKMYKFVKACFVSSGGTGISVLVQVDGLTEYNFTANVIKVHNLLNYAGLDVGCKDITRMTYLSHDNEIYINYRVEALRAIEPSFNTIVRQEVSSSTEGLRIAFNTAKKKYGEMADGNKNNWLMTFFGTNLRVGVDRHTAISYAITNFDAPMKDIEAKGNYVYDNY